MTPKVKVLTEGTTKTEVDMAGHSRQCQNQQPHIPHVVGHYNTTANGWGEYMCDGVEGDTPEGTLHIVWEKRTKSSAYNFAKRQGFWFLQANL
jgi:nitrate reductase cytochrome c-type subunit